jgi:predicted membrane metal-binding protein
MNSSLSGFTLTDEKALGDGLLFGDDTGFSWDFAQLVRQAGVSHVVAASGANLNFVLTLPRLIVGQYWWLFQSVSALCIVLYWNEAVHSGSLWRAIVMWLLNWLALIWGRPSNWGWNVFVVVVVTCWAAPTFLSHGFWLSVLAIIGLSISQSILSSEKKTLILTHSFSCIQKARQSIFGGAYIFLFVMGYLQWFFQSAEPRGIITTWLIQSFLDGYAWISLGDLVLNQFSQVTGVSPGLQFLQWGRGELFSLIVSILSKMTQLSIGKEWYALLLVWLVAKIVRSLRVWWKQERQWRQYEKIMGF